MNQKEYERLTNACDFVLDKFSSDHAIVAIPWLHVLSGHPNSLHKYRFAFQQRHFLLAGKTFLYHIGYIIYKLWRSLFEWRVDLNAVSKKDVVFISHFVNIVMEDGDFYYGGLPAELERTKRLKVLIGMVDHTPGNKNAEQRAKIEAGNTSKILFPKALSFRQEVSFIAQCYSAWRKLRKAWGSETDIDRKAVLRETMFQSFAPETFNALRLHSIVGTLTRRTEPAALVVTWEGWSWERLSVHAVKMINPAARCLGYQHTILYPSSHSVKRSIGPAYDPDAVFTIGDITAGILKEAGRLKHTDIVKYGSHRLLRSPKDEFNKIAATSCLVAPEGIEAECLLLFRLAIETAKKMPGTSFIFRTHPVMPYSVLTGKYTDLAQLPTNCSISDEEDIYTDYNRCNFLLYRGSSVALYAVLNGLRPVYYSIPGEIPIDPLYLLGDWHITVSDTNDFMIAINDDASMPDDKKQALYSAAIVFCKAYASAPDTEIVYRLISSNDPITT